jgi:hypothetical protein
MWLALENKTIICNFVSENQKVRGRTGDISVDGRIIRYETE